MLLNFQKQRGYPMAHIIGEILPGRKFTYQFTHNQAPVVGQEAVSIQSQLQPGLPNADLISIDNIEMPKSPHHGEMVMLYTCTFQLRPILAKTA